MAFRKETVRAQFQEALEPVLEPGEQTVAASLTQAGPSPWLASSFGALGALIFLLLGTRYYFIAVTDRRVVMMKASMWTSRPAGLAFTDARSGVALERVKVANLWSSAWYRRPDGNRMRLNFHRLWRDDMQAVVRELTGARAGSVS